MGRITNLQIQSPKLKYSRKILLLTDLHINHCSKTNIELLSSRLPDIYDLVFILGDIIHDGSSIEDLKMQKEIINNIRELTFNRPTFIITGNHDILKRIRFETYRNYPNLNIEDLLSNRHNIHLVSNKLFKYQDLSVSGFEPSPNYYLNKEKISIFKEEFKDYNKNIYPENTFNIFLIHDPKSIIELSKQEKVIPSLDLCLSGHMHGGLVPSILHKRLNTNYGLVSPTYKLFPNYTRGVVKYNDTLFHVVEPVNTTPEVPLLNELYGPNCTILDLQKGKQLTYKLS